MIYARIERFCDRIVTTIAEYLRNDMSNLSLLGREATLVQGVAVSRALALLAGALFGGGLLLSGMTDPANVIAFLDITGHWRSALAFTMGAAVALAAPAFAIARGRGRFLRGQPFPLIDRTRIDPALIIGSTLFGIGWGISGICPGPGVTLLVSGDVRAFAFMGGLLAGAVLARPRAGSAGTAVSPPPRGA